MNGTELELCADGHAAVAYSMKITCPVCAAKAETMEADEELSKALAQIEDLKEALASKTEATK